MRHRRRWLQPEGSCRDEHPCQQRHTAGGTGNHGAGRRVSRPADVGLWDQSRSRRDAWQRGCLGGGHSSVRYRARGGECHRGEHIDHLRAGPLRTRCHPGGRPRWHLGRCLHHRRHPCARHDQGPRPPRLHRHPPARPQLPGRHQPGPEQSRYHARSYPCARPHRRRVAQRYPHLRGRSRPLRTGFGPVHSRRHRRRPYHRHRLYRRPRAL